MRKKQAYSNVMTNAFDNLDLASFDESIARIKRVVVDSKEEKKMYSIRLKVNTVDAIKRKANDAGIPYQTYINAILDCVAKSS